jgi:transcriptional regulator of aromatic amino acid metabolism
VYNLGTLEANVLSNLRMKSFAVAGLTDASNVHWLNALRQDLGVFVDALVCCTESRSLSQESLQEVCIRHPASKRHAHAAIDQAPSDMWLLCRSG